MGNNIEKINLDYTEKLKIEITQLKKEIEELIKERDYYKKMYNESQNFFVK